MALELPDLEYIDEKFIKPIIGKLDELKMTIKDYQETGMNLKNDMLDLKRNLEAENKVHKSEHDSIWTAIRNINNSPEKTGKSMAMWLDIIWKILLVGGVLVTVIRTFK